MKAEAILYEQTLGINEIVRDVEQHSGPLGDAEHLEAKRRLEDAKRRAEERKRRRA